MIKKLLILAILLSANGPAFAQTVDTAWVRRYNGPGNGDDYANTIAVDGSGNVYVAGYCYVDPVSVYDYATVKYYPNGDTAWVRRYDGPGNGYGDYIYSMVVDNSGNVYVTGRSYGGGTEDDIATIKYYPNGDTAWVRRYNGPPGISSDGAYGIVLDGSKNVCVTGWSCDSSGNHNYLTSKYDPNGNGLWTRRYNGPGNSNEWGRAISVDGFDNVYVTGLIYGAVGSDDYCTMKYYPNGDTAWLRRYNGPGNKIDQPQAIAVDGSNNVYVTGRSVGDGTQSDYATIKYYSTGDTAWVRRYDGPVSWIDEAYALMVDNSSNVYVTGTSYTNGAVGWDIVTIKYYPSGDTAWLRRYNGPGNMDDLARAIAVDASGNVYVAGYTVGAYTYENYVTIKYYPNGDIAWVRAYYGPGDGRDQAYAIALDGSDNVYVTGWSYGSGTGGDYATIKYYQNYPPKVTAPDSSNFLCGSDTIHFTVTATDPNGDDTLTMSGAGIPTPIKGLSPLSAEAKIYIGSEGIYNYVYTVTDSRNATDTDTATWIISFNSPPDSFSLISPLDSALVPYVFAFDWATVPDPDPLDQVKYDLYVSSSPSFHVDSTIIYDSLLLTEYTDTLDRGTYYWKVRAYDSCVKGWSNQTWVLFSAIHGDVNGDGVIELGDVVYLITYLYKNGPAPVPLLSGDANCSGEVELGDVVYLITYLYKGGPPPSCK